MLILNTDHIKATISHRHAYTSKENVEFNRFKVAFTVMVNGKLKHTETYIDMLPEEIFKLVYPNQKIFEGGWEYVIANTSPLTAILDLLTNF